jgi:hypothetical protein
MSLSRKINRERNVWIYKHELFNRERPEDLYMVRRRTCPGLDGRKQRFSSRGATKGSKKATADDGSVTLQANSDEDSIVDDLQTQQRHVIDESLSSDSTPRLAKKRDSLSSRSSAHLEGEGPKPKKSRHEVPQATASDPVLSSPIVDTSILRSVVESNSSKIVFLGEHEEAADDSSLDNKRNDKLEMLEQSMVVSDVAMKLEEYARRARKSGMLPARVRRQGPGVVTPPFSSSYQVSMSASELLTYDDEYDAEEARATDLFGGRGTGTSTSSVVTDSDAEEESLGENKVPKEFMVPPVSMAHAKSITEQLLLKDVTSAAVAGFCMSTAPSGLQDMPRKILQLIASCETLANDFYQYRMALNPAHSGDPAMLMHNVRMNHVQNWEREGSRCDAVRDFKVFSVNCVRKIFWGRGDASVGLSDVDRAALKHTADVWLRSIGMVDQSRNVIQ